MAADVAGAAGNEDAHEGISISAGQASALVPGACVLRCAEIDSHCADGSSAGRAAFEEVRGATGACFVVSRDLRNARAGVASTEDGDGAAAAPAGDLRAEDALRRPRLSAS